jgi:hypothetical protein
LPDSRQQQLHVQQLRRMQLWRQLLLPQQPQQLRRMLQPEQQVLDLRWLVR